MSLACVAAGMAYSFWWPAAFGHPQNWLTPGDIWGAYRGGAMISWGNLQGVYSAGVGIVTFPGLLVLFAPVAALTEHFGLAESFPMTLPHPTAWLVLGPYEMLLGATALFAFDALGERFGLTRDGAWRSAWPARSRSST